MVVTLTGQFVVVLSQIRVVPTKSEHCATTGPHKSGQSCEKSDQFDQRKRHIYRVVYRMDPIFGA